MRIATALIIWIVASWPAFGDAPRATPPLPPLFDGKAFAGWEGNLQAFRIRDGAIVGEQLDKPVPRNEYLCTTKVYRDFELRLKFRLRGENVNAGVQFRSERVPGSTEMIGYQADMGQRYWGCLYDEWRHRLLAGPTKETGRPKSARLLPERRGLVPADFHAGASFPRGRCYFGYLPPPDQHRLGGYTTWRARTSMLEVDGERKVVTTVLELLENVAQQRVGEKLRASQESS